MNWQTIDTVPRDGRDVFVFFEQATVPFVVIAHWDDGSMWEETGFDSKEENEGWWYYKNCVTQKPLEIEPTHWAPLDIPT